ncbi:MAG TPA: cytochrome c peroxidase [Polyangia bacterium]|nr:cytochrome c peroxidase [Polyangia bacterium]
MRASLQTLRTGTAVLALVSTSCGGPQAVGPGSDGGASIDRSKFAAFAPAQLPPPPPDKSNRLADDPAAAKFGQRLFFETAFSGKLLDADNDGSEHALGKRGEAGKVACAGCHIPSAGFSDNRTLNQQISLAAGWGRRRAPSLLDVGQARLITWDGRRDSLYNQPLGVIESPVEMNSSRLYTAQQVEKLHKAEYEALFGALPPLSDAARFPVLTADTVGCRPGIGLVVDPCNGPHHGIPGDKAEYDGMAPADQEAVTQVVVNLGKALGAYERKLGCGPSRFDAWVNGKGTLNDAELRGAQLFVGKGGCANCHSGPYFTDQKFHNVGLQPAVVAVVFVDQNDRGAAQGLAAAIADPLNVKGKFSDGDDGRLPASVGEDMEGAFKTPGLRCVSKRPSFMHTGQYRTLDEVIEFFAEGGRPIGYPGKNELKPLDLTAQDRADLVAFMKALDGPGPDSSLLVPLPR